MIIKKIIKEVKESYELGLSYIEVEFLEMPVKIRVNKNHSRKGKRNDDKYTHNLSLINRTGNGASEVDSYFINEDLEENIFIQKQVWGVIDFQDVEKEVILFLKEIEIENT